MRGAMQSVIPIDYLLDERRSGARLGPIVACGRLSVHCRSLISAVLGRLSVQAKGRWADQACVTVWSLWYVALKTAGAHPIEHRIALPSSPAIRHLANPEIGHLSNAGIVHLPDARAGAAC
ncbi:MAG: hypothetical protein JSW37_01805 [Anaerolineales bacterium]|nr:MAG: hypothetical protein JSW37_01805 [Anaerolineales bacterium]